MIEYPIKTWEGEIFKNNTFPLPMIYIKPNDDDELYKKGNVLLYIKDSKSKYDNRPIIGYIYDSAEFPIKRPNFWNETKYLVIVLSTNWVGYPIDKGFVVVQKDNPRLKEESLQQKQIDIIKPIQDPILENYNDSSDSNNNIIYILIFVILIILSIVLMFN